MSTIKLKRSGTTGSVPTADDLVQGELSINYADNKLFTLSHDNVTVVDLLEIGERVGVATFNGLSGDVFGVSSLNGLTGHLQGVSAWNGSTGTVVFNDYVSSFNGSSGAVDVRNSLLQVGGLSAGSGATFAGLVKLIGGLSADAGATFGGTVTANQVDAAVTASALNVGGYYAFPAGAGGVTGDVLMIANDGDLEFESLKTTATFIVDSDIPLATGIRYKGLFSVPFVKMDVTNIELRSHDVSPAGSGDSLSIALKFIRRSSGLEAASPAIQGTVETVVIPLGGEYHVAVTEANVDTPSVGALNDGSYLVVDVISNAGNHTNFTMLVTMEARP